MVDALVQLGIAHVFVQSRMQEILIPCAKLTSQQIDKTADDVRMAFHGGYSTDINV